MKIVWFSEIKWGYLRTRKQQIIACRPPGVEILFLEPHVRSRANVYRLREEDGIFCATVPFVKAVPSSPLRGVLGWQPARRALDLVVRNRVARLMRRLSFASSDTAFIVSNVYAANVVSRLRRKFLLYDCNDDHASFPGMPDWTKAYFEKTCREADAVFASSSALFEKVARVRGSEARLAYVGNGVDFDRFHAARRTDSDAGIGKPRLGYIGAVAPWLDFDALADLARRRPEWEIVLVGPVILGVEKDVERLTLLPNVSHLPPVPYDDVPELLGGVTVGLVPFRYNDLTRGVNPNKMYEYLACGLPVVATRFSREVEGYPGVVAAVDPGADFAAACGAFVDTVSRAESRAALSARAKTVAREHDWKNIAAEFWRRIGDMAQ